MNEHELQNGVIEAAEVLLKCEVVLDARTATAWGTLRQRLADLRAWQEHANESDRPRYMRTKTCERCEALFFFARQVGTSMSEQGGVYDDLVDSPRPRWIPLELDPIDCEGVLPEWRWVVNFAASPPETRVDFSMVSGQVYVDHRKTCGDENGPRKHCIPYERRWQVNSAKTNAETENESVRAANDLLSLQRRLHDADKQT